MASVPVYENENAVNTRQTIVNNENRIKPCILASAIMSKMPAKAIHIGHGEHGMPTRNKQPCMNKPINRDNSNATSTLDDRKLTTALSRNASCRFLQKRIISTLLLSPMPSAKPLGDKI